MTSKMHFPCSQHRLTTMTPRLSENVVQGLLSVTTGEHMLWRPVTCGKQHSFLHSVKPPFPSTRRFAFLISAFSNYSILFFQLLFKHANTTMWRFLIGRNRTKRAKFRGSPLFQATYNIKTEKQTINSTYLVSVGCGRLAEGKGHKTDSCVSWIFFQDAGCQLCFL